jgi:two-component system, OmpR family, response regulator
MLENSSGVPPRPTVDVENRSSKLVVAADDTKENLLLEKAFLEAAGYRFLGVPSGAECIALVTRVKPRLIMLDIQMPDMDGIETCRRIRAIPDLRKIPIAFVTVCKTANDVRAGMAAGGNDFIVKPFNRERLIERVAYWTSRAAPTSLDRAG